MQNPMKINTPKIIMDIAQAIHNAGGRALLVGGCVRDALMNRPSKDFDLEVYGLDYESLLGLLKPFGQTITVGKAFGVIKFKDLDIDIALPRRDSKVGPGHRGFEVTYDPSLTFEEAARRRDLTINSIGYNPLTAEILDPHKGTDDIKQGVLRATDPKHFAEDPLRALRVMQFAARFNLQIADELKALCAGLDLSELSPERIIDEFDKLLLKSDKPSIGLKFLEDTGLIKYFPEFEIMMGVEQNPIHHPEGDVWVHTLMVIDEAAQLRIGDKQQDQILMYAALSHDFAKPKTQMTKPNGQIGFPGHGEQGAPLAEAFIGRIGGANTLAKKIAALVHDHLAPYLFPAQGAKAGAYRRLVRRLDAAGVTAHDLVRLARADMLGRTTESALQRQCPGLDEFMAQIKALGLEEKAESDIVTGAMLIAKGIKPGPEMGKILKACRDYQDDTGCKDPNKIIKSMTNTKK